MSDTSARYNTIADAFSARLEAIAPERWSAPTPCTDWTVRDLVAHVIGVHRRIVATLDGSEPVEPDLADDLRKQWWQATGNIRDALNDESRATKIVSTMFGEQPFAALVGSLLCGDTLIHTWDLARATGQDERLDPGAVSMTMEMLAPLDDTIRRPGGFATKITPAPDADQQTQLLNFCGRAV
ncbi:MAG: TIGR03086 family metal-binding protein [Pseudonocardiaceae bacterium]